MILFFILGIFFCIISPPWILFSHFFCQKLNGNLPALTSPFKFSCFDRLIFDNIKLRGFSRFDMYIQFSCFDIAGVYVINRQKYDNKKLYHEKATNIDIGSTF